MFAYILKRVLLMLPTLLGVLLLTFVVIQFVPGGPVEQYMAEAKAGVGGGGAEGGGLSYRGAQGVDPKRLEQIKALYGFDKPAHERFLQMLGQFARFDLGKSFFQNKDVWQLVKEKLPVSISLGLWTFFISYLVAVPLGVAKAVRAGSRFDLVTTLLILVGYAIPGFVLGVALLGGLEWLGNQTGERLIPGAMLVAAGIALAVWAVHHCCHSRDPLLPLETLSIHTFRVSIYGGSLFRLAISALPFLLPLLFQVAFGLSPVDAGLLVLAVFAGNLAMKPFTTAIMRRYGFRQVLLVNGVIGVMSIAACAFFTAQTPFALIVAVLFAGGLSRSMQFTCYNSIGFADVPKPRMSEASALFSMSFQLAMGMGVTVAALLLRASMTLQGHEMQAQVGDFRVAFVGVALLGAWALVDVYRLRVGAGESVLNRQ